jgi:cytochrome c553
MHRRLLCLLSMIAWAAACAAPAQSHAAEDARGMAATCMNCHSNEVSGGAIAGIAGREQSALVRELSAFKSGARPSTVMRQITRGFSDEQLESIAGYIAAIKPAPGSGR